MCPHRPENLIFFFFLSFDFFHRFLNLSSPTVLSLTFRRVRLFRYVAALKEGRDIATDRYKVFAIGLGTVFMLMYIGYGVAFYLGARLVRLGEVEPGTVFTVTIR